MMDIEKIRASVFSDETALFRTPAEPEKGDTVALCVRIFKGCAKRALLLLGGTYAVNMRLLHTDACFDWFEAEVVCGEKRLEYCFLLECGENALLCQKNGTVLCTDAPKPDPAMCFRFTPGFHVPQWAKGAVQYQIFIDRFCNGDPSNDVADNEYYYVVGHSKHAKDWSELPGETDIRTFFGGDLQGLYAKLDYLQSVGVEAVYLNPIFVSPSSHKYDTQDYEHIDPHLAVITDDVDHPMQDWEKHNGYAPKYIRRVTSRENLEASDAYFADLCRELHRRGMKIMLDGVFNHCGSFNKWMDREGIYLHKPGYEKGAWQSGDSPYRRFFNYDVKDSETDTEYEGWWDYVTLPKLNYEGDPELCETIYRIAEKWASEPYCIDGWRLDVAADLGHSPEFNHSFWREFRRRVKAINPELLILAEHYGDPSDWLRGDQWDSVMNYDAFMEPVTYFLTGMEKHSDACEPELYQNGEAFFKTMLRNMARFEAPSLYSTMNELSNHDHSRFLTRTNRTVGRLSTLGSEAAGEGIRKGVFREAVVIQMTWPGAPTVYYADEAGQVGWTDPDNRRTYPWGHEDAGLIEMHRTLIRLRREVSCLRYGSVKPLDFDTGMIAYARFDGQSCAIVVCNNNENAISIDLNVAPLGIDADTPFRTVFESDESGFRTDTDTLCAVRNDCIRLNLPATGSVILVK